MLQCCIQCCTVAAAAAAAGGTCSGALSLTPAALPCPALQAKVLAEDVAGLRRKLQAATNAEGVEVRRLRAQKEALEGLCRTLQARHRGSAGGGPEAAGAEGGPSAAGAELAATEMAGLELGAAGCALPGAVAAEAAGSTEELGSRCV
jgi:hypothetical protein